MVTERGRRRGQEVELKVMLTQLHGHMTVEEELFLYETLSLHNYAISKRELTELGRKYLPGGFQALDPLPVTLPGPPIQESGPGILVTPIAEPQPTILSGAPIQEAKPTILVTPTAEPLPTHMGGIPSDRPEPITVMIKEGINNRLPIPSIVLADPVPKIPSKVAGVSDKMAAGNSLSKAGPVAATSPVSSSSSAVLKQPPKVTNKAPCRVDQTTTAKSIRQLETANKVTNFNVTDLINSAKKPINDQGLSVAARAWEKHAGRQGSTLKPLTGNPVQKNAAVEKYIEDIINNPDVVRKSLSRGGFQYRLPDGHGVRYNADGSFNTLLDPLR